MTVNSTIMKIFLKGLFYRVVLNDSLTYDFKNYLDSKIIDLNLESFHRLKTILLDVLIEYNCPVYYIKEI